MKEPNKRVFVGVSRGVDSTATCLMLQGQGHEIVGVTMRVWGDELQDARKLAVRMGIGHYVADECVSFKNTIVKNSIDEYRQRRMPNPCVMCSPLFKFRMLIEWTDKLGCDWVATGHYSRLEERSGYIYIVVSDDEKRDQSYFLWRLGQDALRRYISPLGNYTKQTVRDYLHEKGYEAKSKEGESMEVRFIKGDHRDFLRKQCPGLDAEIGPGWFVSSEGVKLGQHKGFPYYAIGQRKGLEIVLGRPAYVLKINPQKNTIMLGDAEQLKTGYMVAGQDSIVDEDELSLCSELVVCIRYRSRPTPCRVKRLENRRLLACSLAEVSTTIPGQSAVFYDGRRAIGGAFIASQCGTGLVIEQSKNWEQIQKNKNTK